MDLQKNNEIKQEMINDVKKWASCVSNRQKAIKSYNILIEMINGSIKEVPNNCFHDISALQNENIEKKLCLKTHFPIIN